MSTSPAERIDEVRRLADQIVRAHKRGDVAEILGSGARLGSLVARMGVDWTADHWDGRDPLNRYSDYIEERAERAERKRLSKDTE